MGGTPVRHVPGHVPSGSLSGGTRTDSPPFRGESVYRRPVPSAEVRFHAVYPQDGERWACEACPFVGDDHEAIVHTVTHQVAVR